MDGHRTCTKCKRELPVSKFYKRRTPTGTQTFVSWCKICFNSYYRKKGGVAGASKTN